MLDFDIKMADLILVRGAGRVDRAIEEITHSEYSHVAGLVKQNELIEAQGFRPTGYQGLDFYSGCADVFTCDQLTDDQRQRIVQHVMNRIGSHYNYRLIGWELEHYILHIDPPFDEHGQPDCSVLWAEAYRAEGIDPCLGIKEPVPGDLGGSAIFRKAGSY